METPKFMTLKNLRLRVSDALNSEILSCETIDEAKENKDKLIADAVMNTLPSNHWDIALLLEEDMWLADANCGTFDPKLSLIDAIRETVRTDLEEEAQDEWSTLIEHATEIFAELAKNEEEEVFLPSVSWRTATDLADEALEVLARGETPDVDENDNEWIEDENAIEDEEGDF